MRRGEAGSTLIDRPNDAPVPDFHEWQGKGYGRKQFTLSKLIYLHTSIVNIPCLSQRGLVGGFEVRGIECYSTCE